MSLVALALLPLVGLVLYEAAQQKHQAAQEAQAECLRIARLCATSQEQLIDSARQLLMTLSETPAVRSGEGETANALFRQIISRFPSYANVGLLDPAGYVIASGVPFEQSLNLANRSYFQRALAKGRFAIGEYQIGRITRKASLNMACPVIEDGHTRSVLFAALDLNWLLQIASRVELPEGGAMTAIDENGTVLVRLPNPEAWVGRTIAQTPVGRLMLASRSGGTARTIGLDGVERLIAYTPLKTGENARIFVGVSIPRAVAFQAANRTLLRQLGLLAVFALLALVGSWFAADLLVLRHVRAVVHATEQLAAGEAKVRVPVDGHGGELDHLAHSFNEMAETIERRIAERNEAESALQQSEQMFRNLFEYSPTAIFVEDESGTVVDLNPAACALHRATREQLQGRSVRDLVPAELSAEVARSFPLWINGDLSSLESVSVTADGRNVPVEIRGRRIDYGGRPAVLLHVTDITDRQAAQEAVQAAQRDLERRVKERTAELALINAQLNEEVTARKKAQEDLEKTAAELRRSNAELEQFANVASHDLQEPLRMVASYTELLEKRYGDKLGSDAREFIGFAADGARRMQQFVADLLRYSRVGADLELDQPVDLNERLGIALRNLKVALEESDAAVTYDPLPVVRGDPRQLLQLLQNLVGNALKFRGRERPRVHLSAVKLNGHHRLAVADNGLGIEPEHAERIFEIFHRLHPRENYPGTGIGLALCKKIVELHGGRIWVESQKGSGATFFFTLPAAA